MDNIKDFKKMQSFIILALVISSLALLSSIVKNMVTERWAKSRDVVACIPAEIQQSYPMVYAQSDFHPIQSDALIKSFVEEYIHNTQDNQFVNYHSISKDGRYDNVKLNNSLLKAIEMSAESSTERALNMKKYADSYDVLQSLKKCNCGWQFLIDDILLFPNVNSGETLAVVRGEFQVTYDQVKTELPNELWGYREITLNLMQGVPTKDSKENYLNKYGIFVTWSFTRILSSSDRDMLSFRNFDYYMKENR